MKFELLLNWLCSSDLTIDLNVGVCLTLDVLLVATHTHCSVVVDEGDRLNGYFRKILRQTFFPVHACVSYVYWLDVYMDVCMYVCVCVCV